MAKTRALVEIEGFEPSLTEPESVVLPLHHISMLRHSYEWDCKSTTVLSICKDFRGIFVDFPIKECYFL